MPRVTAKAPHIGMKVRLTRSKLETLPMPEDTTITAVIGEQVRAMEAASASAEA